MKNYEVEVNGKVYRVTLKEISDEEYKNDKKTQKEETSNQNKDNNVIEKNSVNNSVEILAPMPGTILNINVDLGSKVNEGDILCVLEAMKMENSIVAAEEGIIKNILVNKGDTVEAGQVLIKY